MIFKLIRNTLHDTICSDRCEPAAMALASRQAEAVLSAVATHVAVLHAEHQCDSYDNCFIIHGGGCAKAGSCCECNKPYPCPTLQLVQEG